MCLSLPPQKRFYEKISDFKNKILLHKELGWAWACMQSSCMVMLI